jgi:hypothetical protein
LEFDPGKNPLFISGQRSWIASASRAARQIAVAVALPKPPIIA